MKFAGRSSARSSRATWARSPARGGTCCNVRHDAKPADEEAGRRGIMVSAECPHVPRQAAAARSAVGEVRRLGYCRHLARCRSSGLAAIFAPVCRRNAPRSSATGGGASGESDRHPADRAGHAVAAEGHCWIWGWAISPSSAARRRFRPANCSGCGWRRRCVRICSAWSTFWTSRRPVCIRRIPRRCSAALDGLKASGNSLFVVEHEIDVIRHADWIVDVGPAAGEHGGRDLVQRAARRACAK